MGRAAWWRRGIEAVVVGGPVADRDLLSNQSVRPVVVMGRTRKAWIALRASLPSGSLPRPCGTPKHRGVAVGPQRRFPVASSQAGDLRRTRRANPFAQRVRGSSRTCGRGCRRRRPAFDLAPAFPSELSPSMGLARACPLPNPASGVSAATYTGTPISLSVVLRPSGSLGLPASPPAPPAC